MEKKTFLSVVVRFLKKSGEREEEEEREKEQKRELGGGFGSSYGRHANRSVSPETSRPHVVRRERSSCQLEERKDKLTR